MRRVVFGTAEAERAFEILARAGEEALAEAEAAAAPILRAVRAEGDAALCRYTRELDGVSLDAEALALGEAEMASALEALPGGVRGALELAAERILAFHRAARPAAVTYLPAPGERLGLRPLPLRRVGLYAPGGRAAYPTTVLMNALPARAAGVEEIYLCTPPGRDGNVPGAVLAAASLGGVKALFRVGGAQAVGAMAYGTATVPRVEKIAGPGNVYVTAAKRLVRGTVEVDKDAGPSEVVVVVDERRWAGWAAADLIAQAEHDPAAMAVGVGIGKATADALADEVERQAAGEARREVIEEALERRGAIVEVRTLEEGLAAAERLAPEHLQLMVKGAEAAAEGVRNAGAIFCGPWSPAPVGDYLAGPNHVLPTGGSARYASPLGVLDFMKWSSLVSLEAEAMARLAGPAATLAELEGLPAHARALRLRRGRAP